MSVTSPLPNRRRLLWGFAGAVATVTTGGVGIVIAFLHSGARGGSPEPRVVIKREELPAAGDPPVRIKRALVTITHLLPGEGPFEGQGSASEPGGLLALMPKCTHLGCTVPWNSQYTFSHTRGWFYCPCHSATFTRTGLRVFGPAPRSLDTYAAEIDDSGNLVVFLAPVIPGDDANATRAVTPPA